MKIRVAIIDDEPLARRNVRRFLEATADMEVIAECGDGAAAVESICRQRPDLVFLDIQIPEMDGFEVVRRVGIERMPPTIFVTAYDEHALQAFEAKALDYLVKPFGRARFSEALRRARQYIAGNLNQQALQSLLAGLAPVTAQNQYADRLPVSHRGHVILVSTTDIDWIQAAGNYVRLHVCGQQYDLRGTLASIENRLNPTDFLRIHRSTIVNVRRIKEIHPWFRGHHLVILQNGHELRMSRYQRDVARRLGVG
jgi:two-component system, LytTR family, response regulator